MKRTVLTLSLIKNDSQVLLGMKKRGFGAGKWNGFGGKIEPNETLNDAAVREIEEEAGIAVQTSDIERVGIHEFIYVDKIHEVHVFDVLHYSGGVTETAEMKPKWFSYDQIPYNEMWEDDKYWMPLYLKGKKFRGRFTFDTSDALLTSDLVEVEVL